MRYWIKRTFLISSAVLPLFLCIAGCGGSSGEQSSSPTLITDSRYVTVKTGTPDNKTTSLGAIHVERVLEPVDQQRIMTYWYISESNSPPSQYNVQLIRFLDADGGAAQAIGEPIEATHPSEQTLSSLFPQPFWGQQGWNFQRPAGDSSSLFVPGGVYMVDIRSTNNKFVTEILQGDVFIAPGLQESGSDDSANGVTVETKNPSNQNAIQNIDVAPSGNAYVARNQEISLSFLRTKGTPPKNWTVFLRRYKEARGDRPFSKTAQPITVEEVASNHWRLRPQGNALLDPYAVYIVEIQGNDNSGRPTTIRHVFITGKD